METAIIKVLDEPLAGTYIHDHKEEAVKRKIPLFKFNGAIYDTKTMKIVFRQVS